MRRYIIFLIAITITIFSFTSCSNVKKDDILEEDKIEKPKLSEQQSEHREDVMPSETDETEEDSLRKYISNMSIEQKIGQMVMVGIEGHIADERAKELIEKYHVGGFILFDRNIEDAKQTTDLINSLKSIGGESSAPLFFAIDEEGGTVSSVPDEFVKIPSSRKIGQVTNEEFCFQIGSVVAEKIKSLGFNMNFAPVLDIDSNPENPVIGSRAFGDNVDIVSRLGVSMMEGLMSEDVISVVKHFPGHGDTSVDSHMDLPVVDHDMDRLNSFELAPFRAAIDAGAEAIMIAHILLPQIDNEIPSSLSSKIIIDILRRDMGFEGVVITDDLTMGAIMKNYRISDASVEAVKAGCDMILVCHGYEGQLAAFESLKEAVEEDILSETRIDESVYRIISLKQKYHLDNAPTGYTDITEINKDVENILNSYLK